MKASSTSRACPRSSACTWNARRRRCGVSHLTGLENLEYLNLYGTKITDKALDQLSSLKNLKQLYVWQTEVTDDGVAKIKKPCPT